MKSWLEKLAEQLGLPIDSDNHREKKKIDKTLSAISDDRATLLFVLDIFTKHLIDIEGHSIRSTREEFDELSRELIKPDSQVDPEKVLFRLRHLFLTYRVDEYTFVRKAFEDFKTILWDLIEQIGEDARFEKNADRELQVRLKELRQAVESDSLDALKSKSREFVDSYVAYNTKKEERRSKKISTIKKNLDQVKQKLVEADKTARTDHLSGAFNRRSFDEHLKAQLNLFAADHRNLTLCILDIDHFKKVNDTYGHDVGDFVIQECVRLLKETFNRKTDFVARIGGEEFAVVMQDHEISHALKRIEPFFKSVREEVIVHKDQKLQFTVSMGLAAAEDMETFEALVKKADEALYKSKTNGRNQWTISGQEKQPLKSVS